MIEATPLIALFGIFFFFMALGLPIAFSMLSASLIVTLVFIGTDPTVFISKIVSGVNLTLWIALPLFILLGSLMTGSGITTRLINLASRIIGRVPGSLSHICVLTHIMMAGMSGSLSADAAAVGSLLNLPMKKVGYPPGYIAAIVGLGAVIGPMIPPSLVMIQVVNTHEHQDEQGVTGNNVMGKLICQSN